jgi:uncharacterized protein with FMN-binding domain
MFRRITFSHPHGPSIHLLIVLIALVAAAFILVVVARTAGAADVVELTSGAKVQGQILSRDAKTVVMNVTVSGVTLKRSYPLASIKAIASGGKREVVRAGDSAPSSASSGAASSRNTDSASITRSRPGSSKAGGGPRSELDALIDRVGREKPDWYDETELNYPSSLDLDWPEPPPEKGWNNQKNVGQFMWDIIHPNPSRWKEGTKLMHHLLERHKDDPETRERVMNKLGHMYHDLLEDYPRAAFWLRAAGVEKNPQAFLRETPLLAECYWRLGYRDEALKLLGKARPTFFQVKLMADMGQTDQALKICDASAKSAPEHAYLFAGDACRVGGRYPKALDYYQKVMALDASGPQGGRVKKFQERASANIAAIKYFELFDPGKVADGTYKASSQGYEAQVEVAVTVAGGKIEDVRVTNHREKQFYSAISDTPKKIIAKQSVKGIDTTSNATITSEAIVNATAKAIGQRAGQTP